ncbi:MAG: MarR family transcriptional regulator, partial [Candidatus Diapherotrites archaeon]
LPDEKALIETLKKFNYELTQSQLTKESGLTKVQVHRAVKKLEDKGVLEKHDYGLTNKIILKKELIE